MRTANNVAIMASKVRLDADQICWRKIPSIVSAFDAYFAVCPPPPQISVENLRYYDATLHDKT